MNIENKFLFRFFIGHHLWTKMTDKKVQRILGVGENQKYACVGTSRYIFVDAENRRQISMKTGVSRYNDYSKKIVIEIYNISPPSPLEMDVQKILVAKMSVGQDDGVKVEFIDSSPGFSRHKFEICRIYSELKKLFK